MGLKGSGTVPPYGTHAALTLQDLPKITQLISSRPGPELFCPQAWRRLSLPLAELVLLGLQSEGQHW